MVFDDEIPKIIRKLLALNALVCRLLVQLTNVKLPSSELGRLLSSKATKPVLPKKDLPLEWVGRNQRTKLNKLCS